MALPDVTTCGRNTTRPRNQAIRWNDYDSEDRASLAAKGKVAKKPDGMRRIIMVEERFAANDVCASADGCCELNDSAERMTNDNEV